MVDGVPQEASIAQGAAHPGVLQVFDTWAQPGQPIWMLLEYCDLGTLQVRPRKCARKCAVSTILHFNEKTVQSQNSSLKLSMHSTNLIGRSRTRLCAEGHGILLQS